ncbi:MAG TPA: hypothetical protein DDZ89_15870 [Clostridiales bacterium]|nr:hypothetical protein [Clostridiales bacterium]
MVRRNTAWRKNNYREIKKSLERYIAILAIIALGVGFFSGLIITRPSMVKTLDSYTSELQMADYRLISTLGLTQEDVEYFSQREEVVAEGAVSFDFIADIGREEEIVLKAHSITEPVNLLNIRYGRSAQSDNECVLDSAKFSKESIGSKVVVSPSNDKDTLDVFAYDEYVVVGLADSANYLNYDRGTTGLGQGSVYAFIYIPMKGFSTEFYTEVQVRMGNKTGEALSKEYKDFITANEAALKTALEERGELRYQEIVDEANEKLKDAQKEYDEGYAEYLTEKADALLKLDDAYEELVSADEKIKEEEENLSDGEKKIEEAELEYQQSVKDYQIAILKYESEKKDAYALLDSGQKDLDQNRLDVQSGMTQIEESGVLVQYAQLNEGVSSMEYALSKMKDKNSEEYVAISQQLNQAKEAVKQIEESGVVEQYGQLQKSLAMINEGQKKLDQERAEAIQLLEDAKKKLLDAKVLLDSGKEKIEENKKAISEGRKTLEEARLEYEKGLAEYEDGRKEAEDSFAEAEEELAEGLAEIEDAWNEIADIPKADVFVLNRNYNIGYASFENDSSIVEGLATVLPIFFFLVAAMVCSTTMSRMVDEHRTQIGTLKAIGYSDGMITGKYISYSGGAAVIGCFIGYFLGTKYFPLAIWQAYGMVYGFTSLEYLFDAKLLVISLIVSLLCSAGVTFVSCKAELLQMPAGLIRPKAPKSGKRILLERIPAIWNRISFLHKVSLRNILRYKRRLTMTILGVAGCTALVVTALGINDSIKNVVNDQFDTIMVYDYNISFSEGQNNVERENFIESYSDVLTECVFVTEGEVELIQDTKIKKASVVATDDPNISHVIGLSSKSGNLLYPSYGNVLINDRLAEEFHKKEGDYVTIRVNGIENADLRVAGIFKNYMNNYLFMTGETYEAFLKKEPIYQNAYASTDHEDLYAVSASLSKDDKVTRVSVLYDMRVMVANMMESLNQIIWLVIAFAAALSFVVIYNLNNINITERAREIATIKVIGFYDRETQQYVFRESFILTLLGTLIGLGFGKLLHMFVMSRIKVDAVSFKEQIFGTSYLLSALITLLITFLVNFMLRKKINKIDMADSLKSVE